MAKKNHDENAMPFSDLPLADQILIATLLEMPQLYDYVPVDNTIMQLHRIHDDKPGVRYGNAEIHALTAEERTVYDSLSEENVEGYVTELANKYFGKPEEKINSSLFDLREFGKELKEGLVENAAELAANSRASYLLIGAQDKGETVSMTFTTNLVDDERALIQFYDILNCLFNGSKVQSAEPKNMVVAEFMKGFTTTLQDIIGEEKIERFRRDAKEIERKNIN